MSFQSAVLQDFLLRWIPELMPDIIEWLPRFFLLVILCPTGAFHVCKCISFSMLWICIFELKAKRTAYKLSFLPNLPIQSLSNSLLYDTHLRIPRNTSQDLLNLRNSLPFCLCRHIHAWYVSPAWETSLLLDKEQNCLAQEEKNIAEICFVLGREEKDNIWCLRNLISDFAR